MTFGSLFSGIGGIDLGLERAGMRCLWQSEIDTYASRVLKKHWPHVPNLGDITRIDWGGVERPDLVCGGFPCQDISFAGKGAGLAGARSGLWYEFARCIRELGPRYVFVENVAALLVRGLDAVLGTLASLGYDAEWHVIPAAAVGAPHIRERVFLLAYLDLPGREALRTCSVGSGPFNEVGLRDPSLANPEGLDGIGIGSEPGGAILPGMGGNPSLADHDGERLEGSKLQWERVCILQRPVNGSGWPVEPDVGRVADGVPARVDRLRGLGNAVVPQVAEYIGRMILEAPA
jgi:DNA (cytosine-5)-methyltransferase 1